MIDRDYEIAVVSAAYERAKRDPAVRRKYGFGGILGWITLAIEILPLIRDLIDLLRRKQQAAAVYGSDRARSALELDGTDLSLYDHLAAAEAEVAR